MVLPAVAIQDLSFDTVKEMGWYNVLWLIGVGFGILAAKAKKIGVTSIGKNELGMLEILGFPICPVPFGLWPFIKGIFHVKQVSTTTLRIPMAARRLVGGQVLYVVITVWVTVTKPAESLRERISFARFVQIRRELIAAIYGALDENVDDAENPARTILTIDIVEDATRAILKESQNVDAVTLAELIDTCGEDLRDILGEYIRKVYIREDAPTEAQIWANARKGYVYDELPAGTQDDLDDDTATAAVIGIASHSSA